MLHADEKVQDRKIEIERGVGGEPVPFAQDKGHGAPLDKMQRTLVRMRNAFGVSRGPGDVEDIGEVARCFTRAQVAGTG